MEEKVQYMMKIIDDDGDSFAKRAEMYYRKRPELINSVEEYFRAYRDIAERYDNLSRELQHANRTIATVYPEKVQFAMDEEEENVVPHPKAMASLPKPIGIPKVPDAPKKDFLASTTATSKRKHLKKTTSSIIASKCSGLGKTEALDEIDKLQKEILVLQTEKEFLKSSYERGAAKHWEIENQIVQMQTKVSDLQDEFGIGTVIEDDDARSLMANTALKSCHETLAKLQEEQERAAEEAREEHQKLKETRQKLQGLRHQFLLAQDKGKDNETLSTRQGEESELSMKQEESITTSADMDLQLLREKIKEQLELNSLNTATEVADKIDELVEKVITLGAAISSQTALVRRLRLETEELQRHVRTLEEDKEILIEDSDSMRTKIRQLEEELSRIQSLNRSVEDQNNNLQTHFTEASHALDHLSEKLQGVKLDMEFEEVRAVSEVLPEEEIQEHGDELCQRDAEAAEVRAVSDVLQEKELFKEHEDMLPQGDMETNVGKKDENPDHRSCVKAEEENFTPYIPGIGLMISENQEKKGDVPDLSHSAKTPEKGQELKGQEEDETQEWSHKADSNPDAEDQDLGMEEGDQPNWRQLFLNGLDNREKALLDEYTSILRSFKEVKRKLSDAERKNRDGLFELAMQIKELKTANAFKDDEIRSLRQNISPQTNPGGNQDTGFSADHASISRETSSWFSNIPSPDPEHQPIAGSAPPLTKEEQGESKDIPVDKSLTITTIEEKIRADIDDILEENLEFWLRFSTSYHQVKKFQTSIQDLQAELLKLQEDKKNGEGTTTKQRSIKSDARPIYTHMREIQTDLTLWLEHNTLLKEELQGRFSSLCNIQEETSRILDADSNAQEAEVSHYQAAKFQGELLNMKQENIKIKEELLKSLNRVRGLQLEVERTLSQMDEDFEISKSKNLKDSVNRTRLPLRSFLFGVKLKKQKPSFFSCMSPTLQKQYSDLTVGLPP